MLALTCILVRSSPMVKRVGEEKLAATVWPRSTLRAMTVPDMGLVIIVWERFSLAVSRVAFACVRRDWSALYLASVESS